VEADSKKIIIQSYKIIKTYLPVVGNILPSGARNLSLAIT
jgi:hypothetical protein